ncbi:telomere binding protein [Rhodotorula toruloides]|uniref:BY PROTMAP: gi/472580375/gb/EMS18182.1/ telomeric DNA binding protein [Rhodosporidium toruloides NP11] gi/647402902/emb/CDR49088.1/ RHTO0S23e00386g1_1 [Rhodosporidium toruloides] n=1 Tax=Rhodotorula toruloides TaxID=5286 RepID=A0A0K3CD09_RHOTO|nr:Telomere length regulation protein-domain containing protein [Rhodotorula toruloides]
MPVAATPDTPSGSSLSARLAEPLASTDELLDLLLPPLQSLSLLSDQPSLAQRHARSPFPFRAERFARRQLGLVQKVLVEKVWPEWEGALEAEEGAAGLVIFERFFVPPPTAFASTSSDASSNGATVAISAYNVLSSVLSSKTVSTLPPRSVELALDLLAKLSSAFNVEELYMATVGSSALEKNVDGAEPEDEDSFADPAAVARWETTQRVLLGVPTRAANARGVMQGKGKKVMREFPQELHLDFFASACARSLADLVWRLADDATLPVSRSALSSILPSLTSGSALDVLLSLAIPQFSPPETFPAPADILLRRQRHIDLWRAVADELSERDLQRFMRSVLASITQKLRSRPDGTVLQQARAAAFVLDSFFGALNPANKATWKAALAVFFDVRGTPDTDLTPLLAVFWAAGEAARVELLKEVLKIWGNAEEIQAGLGSRRLYLTSLLLSLVVSLPPLQPDLVTLSRSPAFLSAVSTHLSLVAPLQRLLGMLVAEIVSARTVDPKGELKPLDFGAEIWAGDSPDKSKIRHLRGVLAQVEAAAAGKVEGWQDVLRQLSSSKATSSQAPAPGPIATAPLKPTSVEEPPVQPAKPKRPMISIIGDDDSDDDFEPLPLPPGPSEATLEALASDDPALYHSAFPSQQAATAGPAGGASHTRKRGKLRPPVYIPELVAYLKGEDPQGAKEEADGEAERVEMGLKEGEALVRRKAGWGGELRENAVDLAFALMGLHNKFELDDFEQHKQAILVALLVACPTEVAPAVIEQYFTNSYSVAQRHVLLAALALAARESAGLSTPTSAPKSHIADRDEQFPSKRLPPQLHRRLAGASTNSDGPVEALSADLTRMALSGAREDAETSLPEAAREKLLKVRGTTRRSARLDVAQDASSTPTFASIAAEIFILPFINRFWLYLRDTATSSLAVRRTQSVGPYAGGAPAPMLLEPMLLAKFLATLAVLVHAARHSPAFLAVIVPETLAFILAIKPAHPSAVVSARAIEEDTGLDTDLVVSSALELVLVALDATVQLDGGRTLMSASAANGEGGAIVADVKDWAEEVFEREERRGGDVIVGRPGRAAAGVLLRVDEIVGRWRVAVGW